MAGMASRAASATICWRGWQRTDRHRPEARWRAAAAERRRRRRSRPGCWHGEQAVARPSMRAASCASLCVRAVSGLFEFANRAVTAALGTSSRSSPSALPPSTAVEKADPRDVAARPVEAGDKALLDRVATEREHDWNRRGRRLGGRNLNCASPGRGDHRHLAARPDRPPAPASRSCWLSAKRYSIATLRPST